MFGQTRIDDTIPFQSDPAKQYSIYIPSSYDENEPNKLMVGLHPFNVNRWNSISWCDTLIAFAEANNLLMICPDGGADGKVDDPIDTAFTTAMIDSMLHWYNVDESKIFAMGFSWGGRTTYSYGLNHIERFAGFLPIGAAVNGTNEVNGVLQNAIGKPYYIVHGSFDNPNARFYPIRDALIDNQACVESNFMNGVGHTIDFPNRNAILTEAFLWIDSVSCQIVNVGEANINSHIEIYPNPLTVGDDLQIKYPFGNNSSGGINIYDTSGKMIMEVNLGEKVATSSLRPGVYFIKITIKNSEVVKKIVLK